MREAGFKNIDKAAAKRRLLRRYAPRNDTVRLLLAMTQCAGMAYTSCRFCSAKAALFAEQSPFVDCAFAKREILAKN